MMELTEFISPENRNSILTENETLGVDRVLGTLDTLDQGF